MTNQQAVIDTYPDPLVVPATGNWHPEYIKFRLALAGTSLARLSRTKRLTNGREYTRTWAQHALYRQFPSGEAAIAKAIGVEPITIWPSRYNQDGTPRRDGSPSAPLTRKSINASAARNAYRRGRY